ncbi:MAG: hypothetical protein ACI92I_000896 [Acidimicrobiales bacterium]|jgi:hypothetical protein
MNKYKPQNEKGFALLLALIVSSIALSIGLSMLSMTLKQLELGTTTFGSEVAFQSANAGMECFRYLRDSQPDNFTEEGGVVDGSCFGNTILMDDLIRGNGIEQRKQSFTTQFDWSTSADTQVCIEFEIMVLNSTNDETSHNFVDRDTAKVCDLGNVCTYGFVQGFNLDCASKDTSIFTTQRELYIEF